MDWSEYRREIDSADFDPDFSARTLRMLEACRSEKNDAAVETVKRTMHVTVIAAVLAAVFCFSAAAAAIISNVRYSAFIEMGIDPQKLIPGVTEYPEGPGENSNVQLLITACSGTRMDACLAISPVPLSIGSSLAAGESHYGWDFGKIDTEEKTATVLFDTVSYEAETMTALVRMTLMSEALTSGMKSVVVSPVIRSGSGSIYFGKINIPITDSAVLTGKANCKLSFGTVTDVNIGAGYIELCILAPGELQDSIDDIEPVMREYQKTLKNSELADITIQYKSGHSVPVRSLPSMFDSDWVVANGDLSAVENGSFRVEHICTEMLDIGDIVSVTVAGTVIPVV